MAHNGTPGGRWTQPYQEDGLEGGSSLKNLLIAKLMKGLDEEE